MKQLRSSWEASFLASFLLCLLAGTPSATASESRTLALGVDDKLIFADWLIQDTADKAPQCFKSNTDATGEKEIIEKVFTELEADAAGLRSEFAQLQKDEVVGSDPRWRNLYNRACRLRRAKRLAPLADKYNSIIFTKHYNLGGSHYAYTENLSDTQYLEKRDNVTDRHGGASLCILRISPASRLSQETLLTEANGVIRDPAVSNDGKRVLFAWRKSMTDDDYHLYDMDIESRQIRQLTSGKGFADFERGFAGAFDQECLVSLLSDQGRDRGAAGPAPGDDHVVFVCREVHRLGHRRYSNDNEDETGSPGITALDPKPRVS